MKPAIVVLIVLSCAAAARAQSSAEKQLFDLINREREKAGASKLEWNDGLAQAAQRHSQLLDQHQSLSHRFAGEPDLQERVGATGVRFNSVAENVAMAPEVETAHAGLMESPGHRANILSPAYNAVGLSIIQSGHQLFVTQDFAHILVSYSEKQFRNAVITRFNQARRAQGLPLIGITADSRLRKAACAQDLN